MDSTRTVVDDALDQLVHQFSDPLAFLRELVQNAIDAGSSEVAIGSTWEGGVTTIHVDDWGEGMTREIIETRLTRLFSSTKEGDHTKIGRFGIGFVSVFALDPDAVCLDTSREGESWRVLFGRDRSFDLRRLPTAVDGTKIRIIKTMTQAEHDALHAAIPLTVRRWCRHTGCEIRVDGVAINEALDLPQAPCRVIHRHADLQVVVGHPQGGVPFFGFYNAGLTLFEGHAAYPDMPELAGIAWKASSPQLEHTLARDKVIEDRGHARALSCVRELAVTGLAARAIEMLGEELLRPSQPSRLAYLCEAVTWHAGRQRSSIPRAAWRRGMLPTPAGSSVSLRSVAGKHHDDEILLAGMRSPLTDALEQRGYTVLLATDPAVVAMLRTIASTDVAVVPIGARWCMPLPATQAPDAPGMATLLVASTQVLQRWGARVRSVELARFDYPESSIAELPVLSRRSAGEPVRLDVARTLPTAWLARRTRVLVNHENPAAHELARVALRHPGLAAHLLLKQFWLGVGLDARLDGELAGIAMELT